MKSRWASDEECVAAHSAAPNEHGCVEWTGGRDQLGYGRISIRGTTVRAHRLSWELKNGPIPAGMIVCHKCDNPPCINPDHLFIGTHRDNAADRFAKGRDWQSQRTHCPYGHAYDEANTKIFDGRRMCRACGRRKRLSLYWSNPERAREKALACYHDNRDEYLKKKRDRYRKNPEASRNKSREKSREWRAAHPERTKELRNRYRLAHIDDERERSRVHSAARRAALTESGRELQREYRRQYYDKNREAINARRAELRREKRAEASRDGIAQNTRPLPLVATTAPGAQQEGVTA